MRGLRHPTSDPPIPELDTNIPYQSSDRPLLLPPSAASDQRSVCINLDKTAFKPGTEIPKGLKWNEQRLLMLANPPVDSIGPGIIHVLYRACLSSKLQVCNNADCVANRYTISSLISPCKTWKGFENWVLQLAACLCTSIAGESEYALGSEPQSGLRLLVHGLAWMIIDCDVLHPSGEFNPPMTEPCRAWEQSVCLPEIFGLCSWLHTISTGRYEALYPHRHLDSVKSEFNSQINAALERSSKMVLCPERISAIIRNLPGGDLNLPALVPHQISNIWSREGHSVCAYDHCEESIKNFTSVSQLHLCDDHDCPTVLLDPALLPDPTKTGSPTAWTLDGTSMVHNPGSFMAISHVWADGTGAGVQPSGNVNGCLFDFFRDIARQLECEGIWWDTICMPVDKDARFIAIDNMHSNYEMAKLTLVHDIFLSNFEWTDPGTACFAIVMSTWFTRGWAALELARSKVVKVLFKNGVIKDLDKEILARIGKPSSPFHQVATGLIAGLRMNGKQAIDDLDTLLTALGPRYTSWSKDKAIIAGLLVRVPRPSELPQQEIYRQIMLRIRTISSAHLFHGMATMPGHSLPWCPTDLFRMPVHTSQGLGLSTPLFVDKHGLLGGPWAVWCLSVCRSSVVFLWENSHPVMRARLQVALRDQKNVLLTEPWHTGLGRGLLVQIRTSEQYDDEETRYPSPLTLSAVLIGTVNFREVEKLARRTTMDVRIGGHSEWDYPYLEEDGRQTACQYVSGVLDQVDIRSRDLSAEYNGEFTCMC